MSRFEDGSYGSAAGVALIAKALAGRCTINYTRAAVGRGYIPDDKTPKTMTDCAEYVMDAVIADVTNPVDGECQVTVQLMSDNVQQGFYATNIVLFAQDPDIGEIAYTYLSLENEPEWIRPASSAVGKLSTFDIIAAVGDVDIVHAVISPDALMTRATAEKLLAEATSLSVSEIYIPRDGWEAAKEQDAVENSFLFCQNIALSGVHSNQFPAIAIRSDDLGIAQSAGFCSTAQTLEGVVRVWSRKVPAGDIEAFLALYDTRSSVIKTIIISAGKWEKVYAGANLNRFEYYQDVEVRGVTQDRFPTVALHIPSLAVAEKAGLCPTVQTLSGALRFWSEKIPDKDLSATVALLFHASGQGFAGAAGSGSDYAIPPATADTLGGVKIGKGILVTSDGTVSVDEETTGVTFATDEEVRVTLEEVFRRADEE